MTAAEPLEGKPAAPDGTPAVDSLERVIGAARMKTALITDERAQRQLVQADEPSGQHRGQAAVPVPKGCLILRAFHTAAADVVL